MNPESDMGYKKYIGWEATAANNPNFKFLFSDERLRVYQKKITDLLQGVGPDGRSIIVPINRIKPVLFQCYETNKPRVGDIYSRYIQEAEDGRNDVSEIVDRAINIIVSQIRNEYDTITNNRKLTVWNSLYGDFNKEGLRAHSQIKLNKKRIPFMLFNMNY